ncbi:MAG: hypothetical protein EA344_10450, partial [Alkalicoccus sp.]
PASPPLWRKAISLSKSSVTVQCWYRQKTSLPLGRLAVEEISSFLRLTPCGIFQSPSSTGVRRFPLRFYRERDVLLLFMIPISSSVKPVTGQRHLRKKKAGRSPRLSGKPHVFSAASEEKSRRHSKNNTEL